jgi:hypothetical protein
MIRAAAKDAIKAVAELGYLNKFSNMSDTWFVAHRVPGGKSADAPPIDAAVAYLLIDSGMVKAAGSGVVLSDSGTRIVWYTAQ